MTILGNIAERLRTDIGENLRASIDVDYSRQLTEDRFNTKRQSAKDQKDADIRINDRQNALADEARKQKYTIQTKMLFDIHEQDKVKGDFSNTLSFAQNEKMLPLVAQSGVILATNSSGKSLESLRFDADTKNKVRQADAADLRNTISQQGVDLRVKEFAFKELKDRNDAINDEMDRIREKDSVFGYVNYINTSPALTEEQRAKWVPAVEGPVNLETAKNIFDAIQKENLQRMKELAKQASSSGESKTDKPLAPASPTTADKDLVRTFLPDIKARMPGFDELSDEDQENVISFIAGEVKAIGKLTRESPNDSVLEALETAKAGFVSRAKELGMAAQFSNQLFGGLSDFLKINPSIVSSFSAAAAAESKGSGSQTATRRLNADGTFTDI